MFSAKAGEPSAIFMNIHNTGNEDVSLALVQSDIRADIVLHGTQHGKMIEVTGINLPAHQMTALKRGGLHIMVFNVEQDLNVGDSFLCVYSLTTVKSCILRQKLFNTNKSPQKSSKIRDMICYFQHG